MGSYDEGAALDLGDDVLAIVMSLLGPDDLARACCVSREWRAAASSEPLWREHCWVTFGLDACRAVDRKSTPPPTWQATYAAWAREHPRTECRGLTRRAARAVNLIHGAALRLDLPSIAESMTPGLPATPPNTDAAPPSRGTGEPADDAARPDAEERAWALEEGGDVVRALYRATGGQATIIDTAMSQMLRGSKGRVPFHDMAMHPRSQAFWNGMLGSYQAYGRIISLRVLLPVIARFLTRGMTRQSDLWIALDPRQHFRAVATSLENKLVVVSASPPFTGAHRVLFVDKRDGTAYLSTRVPGMVIPACWVDPSRRASEFIVSGDQAAQAIRDGGGKVPGDLLTWLEEFADRAWHGRFQVGPPVPENDPSVGWPREEPAADRAEQGVRGLLLFASGEQDGMVHAVTRGIHVRAAASVMPEECNPPMGQIAFMYRIRFALEAEAASESAQSSATEQAGAGAGAAARRTVQLQDRHWTMKDGEDRVVHVVEGPGVVGMHPLLEEGKGEFFYQSMTGQTESRGSLGGWFTFVEGSLEAARAGASSGVVRAECPHFATNVPDFIF
ncbi:unnamed protein product [Pedinophyceae sp. YPF-701]|nr:unnamed protein product [Pedinophyceae sp. YPF-701]